MANPNIGRLRPAGFAKRGLIVPTVPIVAGTFIVPDQFPRYLPPWAWSLSQPPLESPAHSAQRETPVKVVTGPSSINGKKLTVEIEPTDVFGHLCLAGFGQDTVTGDGVADVSCHNFESLDAAVLPLYDVWDNGGAAPAGQQNGYAACMMDKWEFQMKKGEMHVVDTTWNGMFYVPDLALSPAVVYSPLRPLAWNQTEFLLDDVVQTDAQVFVATIENQVVADHVFRDDTNDPMQIWSEGQLPSTAFETILTDVAEINKFRANVMGFTKIEARITSAETFVEGVLPPEAYAIHVQMPRMFYRTGEVQYPTGVIRAVYTGSGEPLVGTIGSGGNAYTWTTPRSMVVHFINGVPAAY